MILHVDPLTWSNRQTLDFSKLLVLKIGSALGSLILLIKTISSSFSSEAMQARDLIQWLLLLSILSIHFSCRNLRSVKIGSQCLLFSLTAGLSLLLLASAHNPLAPTYHYVSALLLFAGFQLSFRTVLGLLIYFSALYLSIAFQLFGIHEPVDLIEVFNPAVYYDRIIELAIITLFVGLYHRLKERQYKIIAEHERSLSHREKLLSVSRMAAGIAHEINNPLSIVLGYVEIMTKADGKRLDPKVYPRILKACERIAVIVKGIQEISQETDSRPEEFDLAKSLQAHLEKIADTPSLRKVESRLEGLNLQLKMPRGVWDPIIKALVENAFEAANQQQNPQVNVSLTPHEAGISLIIADNGPPFDERNISRFFEPFYSSKFDSHGRGMGLTIAHVLATRMGWSIEIKRQGSWTKVQITIPQTSIQMLQTLLPEVS